jgi:hypothetical protein
LKNDPEQKRMEEAGITSEIVDAASSAYIYEIIKRHSFNSPVLFTKDRTDLMQTEYLRKEEKIQLIEFIFI